MKDSHFCYLNGLHASQEPKLRLYGERSPWYRQISAIGLVSTFAVLGMVFGLTTGIYSCSQKQEVKEVIAFEYPIAHTFDGKSLPEQGAKPSEKRRP